MSEQATTTEDGFHLDAPLAAQGALVENEVQGDYYTREIPFGVLRALIDVGVLVHVASSVYPSGHVTRFFAPASEAHDYRLESMPEGMAVPEAARQVKPRHLPSPNYATDSEED